MFWKKGKVMYISADGFSSKSLQRKFGTKLSGLMGMPLLAAGAF